MLKTVSAGVTRTASTQPTIGVTMGDPAGIGPEITLKAVAEGDVRDGNRLVVLGDLGHLRSVAGRHGIEVELRRVDGVADATAEGPVDVIDFHNVGDVEYGEVGAENGRASLEYVDRAIDLAIEGAVEGLANAPIHKNAIARAGSEFAGHTDMMAARTDTDRHTVLVTDGQVRVTNLSLHAPLADAIERVSTESVLETIRITDDLLPEVGLDGATLGVLGLNPHAGDGGVSATGITLGFPFVRATTLHGTAYDIAGQGIAAPDSMIATIDIVADTIRRRG